MEKSPRPRLHSPEPPTTFVQADASAFRDVVQRLTSPSPPPTCPEFTTVSKPAYTLPERRLQARRPKLVILKPTSLLQANVFSPQETKSPSPTGYAFSSPLLSPTQCLSKLVIGVEARTMPSALNKAEEEKAIEEKRFYLHPSPRSETRIADPELLPLFPLTSSKS